MAQWREPKPIRLALAAEPFRLREGSIDVTRSLGVASTTAPGGIEADCVIREADEALYQAKHDGRNRVERSLTMTPSFPVTVSREIRNPRHSNSSDVLA